MTETVISWVSLGFTITGICLSAYGAWLAFRFRHFDKDYRP